MRNAIVTLAINYPPIHWSRPLFQLYATKVGADYVELDTPKIKHPTCPMLEKYQLYDVLGRYARVVFFDADILVQPKTPNLFMIVPPEKIGAVYDCVDNNERNTNRMPSIANAQRILGKINWPDGYFNSGVMVLSQIHRKIFKVDPRLFKIKQKTMLEQGTTNYNIKKNRIPIHKLDRTFNRIAFGSDKGFYEKGKLAYVIHGAGRSSRTKLMKKFFYIIMGA